MADGKKASDTNTISEHLKAMFERAMDREANRVARDLVDLMVREREAELKGKADE